MIDLTPLFQAIITLLATIITGFIIPWLRSKLTLNQEEMLHRTVRTLVLAAEGIYGAGFGYEKMKYVKEQLGKKGFTIDEATIEAAVKEYINFEPETLTLRTDEPEEVEET